MLKELFFFAFVATGIINIIHFGLNIVGANIYDIKQFLRKRKLPKRYHERRPLVSVLIPAHNEEAVIIRTLESVRTNTYRKLEIIVIDDASTDNTRRLVMQYICQHPNRAISLLSKRKNVGKAGALNHALKRHAKGDLIMTLDADSVIHKKAITNAVSYFKDERVVGVAANVQIMENISILGLLQKFEHMIGYRSKKFYSLANCEFIVGGVASTYRRSILEQVKLYDTDTVTEDIGLSLKIAALGNKAYRLVYAADVVAMTEGVQTFKQLLRQRYRWKLGMLQNLLKNRKLMGSWDAKYTKTMTYYRVPMAYLGEILLLIEPFVLIYIFYLSIVYQTLVLLLGAYMTITAYVLWNLWPDEHLKIRKKLQMSLFAPGIYFAFYIMSLVQIVSIFRCVFNIRKVLRLGAHEQSWTSPTRSGKAVQFS